MRHTSVVWGMPGEAVAIGATEDVLPIEEIAPRICGDGGRRWTSQRPAVGERLTGSILADAGR